ncbi:MULTISPECIES: trans-sulfuration enzyme family protein [Bacillaceae]|uniref:trans-sulfuration enzyme family protein n=1 Tax=Bacillaceae TaxID=186817 RepID=UPI000BFBBBCB|nr:MULTISPECIES: aminotransferase class I/II-fold pyridoxal phosphate-dependent enzyme [Bacillaceae]PGT89008.1 cystathionine gamma-synthase [Bacillus sp. AFS040349]UGB30635.1 aminotransferase class I/II-fold pyridoxal phosphate-dependent enzyme [Metabacillus sp. B2-18]
MLHIDEKICTHFGEDPSQHHGSISPPIYQTSLFAFENFKEFTEAQNLEREHYVYSRGVNPTVEVLEKKLAALERGDKCKCFGSGMGAISAVFFSLLESGDHVLFINNIYGPTTQLLTHLKKFNISCSYVDHELNNINDAIQDNTKMIYVESPGTMLMNIVDLQAVATIAKERGIITAIDNTWSTPIFQKPLTLGFDLSIHSLTKYIGGHSDVVGGAVIGSFELVDKIFKYGYQLNGSVLGANDAFLIIRGLRTLPIRLKQHHENALKIIDYLQSKQEVERIYHPSLEKGKPFLEQQMKGFTGLLSFELKEANFSSVCKFIDGLSLFKIGVSWGGFESLVNAPVKVNNEEILKQQGISPGLIRLSVGLEGSDLQISDLEHGFQQL